MASGAVEAWPGLFVWLLHDVPRKGSCIPLVHERAIIHAAAVLVPQRACCHCAVQARGQLQADGAVADPHSLLLVVLLLLVLLLLL